MMNMQSALNLSEYSSLEQTYENHLNQLRTNVREMTDEIINKLNHMKSVSVWVFQQAANVIQEMDLTVTEMTEQIRERLCHQLELNWLQHNIVKSQFSSFPLTLLANMIGSLHCHLWQFIRLPVPILELKWKFRKVRRVFEEYCELNINYNPYALCSDPVWNNTDAGFHVPSSEGMAIDQITGNIYVAGYRNQGIKVFNQTGSYLTCFVSELLEFAYDVCCIPNYLYVTTIRNVVKVDKISGKVLASRKLGFEPGGTAVDKHNNVYVCHCTEPKVTVFDANLTNCRTITLKTPHYTPNNTLIQCLYLTSDEMYVLFEHSSFPIQCFTYKGKLKRGVILENQIENASDFCLDNQSNILVNDLSGKQIKIFSKNGDYLQCINKMGCRQRGRTNVVTRGLAVTQCNRIVTSLPRATNCIQVY